MSYITTNENAMFYECGFSSDNAIFIRINDKKAFFITDSRYTLEAKNEIKNAKVVDAKNLILKAKEILRKNKVKKLEIDPKDWNIEKFEIFKQKLDIKFIKKAAMQKRITKTQDEIKIIKKAVKKGELAFDEFAKFIQENGVGLSERELQFEAARIFQNKGKLGLSFPPIVAINENAAKPHALPSKKLLQTGDLLLVDAGVLYKRYCSDRTRVTQIDANFNFSKKQSFTDKKRQKIYDIVLKAQEEAIKFSKPGVKCAHIDKVARDVITKAGYGKYFSHSTGHGVGLDIHELPVISTSSKDILQEGMVFTIEPGIYLPDEFGVRIEDMILVTKSGVEIL